MFGYDRIPVKQSIYHKVETLILPTRQEASIFIPLSIKSDELPRFLKENNIKLFAWVIYACLKSVKAYPQLNQFVLNHHLYQNRFHTISTLVKQDKTKVDKNSSIKLYFDVDSDVLTIQHILDKEVQSVRNDKIASSDALFKMLSLLPIPIFKLILVIARFLDSIDLLPNSIIHQDPLHSSLMIANLGSIKGQSVFHHLFNWGTISIFIAMGEMDTEGSLELSFTIDERISEGLIFFKALDYFKDILEHPNAYYS